MSPDYDGFHIPADLAERLQRIWPGCTAIYSTAVRNLSVFIPNVETVLVRNDRGTVVAELKREFFDNWLRSGQ